MADVYTILASTDKNGGARGMSCFMVDAGTPGLSFGKSEDKMGIRASHTGDVVMEDVRIPAKNLIGTEGDGFKIVMETLDKGRANAAASSLGVSRRAIEESVKYAQQRVTMKKQIYKHELVQAMLADMGMLYESARMLTWRAAAALDAGAPEAAKLCAMAKCFATDAAVKISDMALQIHGGYGYMRDYPIEKLYRDARIFPIFEGTNEIQRTIIAKYMVAENKVVAR
jgi:Acyl-CoA dehydrogenases